MINLKPLGMDLTLQMQARFEIWQKLFLEYNSHTNLMSKNDEKFLFEKHVFDSLALNLFFKKYKIERATILDFGT